MWRFINNFTPSPTKAVINVSKLFPPRMFYFYPESISRPSFSFLVFPWYYARHRFRFSSRRGDFQDLAFIVFRKITLLPRYRESSECFVITHRIIIISRSRSKYNSSTTSVKIVIIDAENLCHRQFVKINTIFFFFSFRNLSFITHFTIRQTRLRASREFFSRFVFFAKIYGKENLQFSPVVNYIVYFLFVIF